MITITKRLEWDSAHRVLRHESKCATLHGHRYAAEITVGAHELDSLGRVIDFSVVKGVLGAWIDNNWDHTTLCNGEDVALIEFCRRQAEKHGNRPPWLFDHGEEPTAENIAATLFRVGQTLLLPHKVQLIEVVVWETPTSRATCRR